MSHEPGKLEWTEKQIERIADLIMNPDLEINKKGEFYFNESKLAPYIKEYLDLRYPLVQSKTTKLWSFKGAPKEYDTILRAGRGRLKVYRDEVMEYLYKISGITDFMNAMDDKETIKLLREYGGIISEESRNE